MLIWSRSVGLVDFRSRLTPLDVEVVSVTSNCGSLQGLDAVIGWGRERFQGEGPGPPPFSRKVSARAKVTLEVVLLAVVLTAGWSAGWTTVVLSAGWVAGLGPVVLTAGWEAGSTLVVLSAGWAAGWDRVVLTAGGSAGWVLAARLGDGVVGAMSSEVILKGPTLVLMNLVTRKLLGSLGVDPKSQVLPNIFLIRSRMFFQM